MTLFILGKLLLLPAFLLGIEAAQCNRDNCFRALAATPTKASSFCASYTKAPNTATAIPTYGAACSSSPSRVSSACSCVVTSPPTCVPTPIIKGTVGNGNFDNYPPPESAVFNIQPPWYYSREENGFGEYKTEPVFAGYGGVVAAFRLDGQNPDVLPGAVVRLSQQISWCNGTTYAFSLYARQYPSTSQSCRLSFFTGYEGSIGDWETPAFSELFRKFGPVTRRIYRDNGEVNAKGEYSDILNIIVQCTGITGQPVRNTLFEVDSVIVEPV